jgi:hypothetical protein
MAGSLVCGNSATFWHFHASNKRPSKSEILGMNVLVIAPGSRRKGTKRSESNLRIPWASKLYIINSGDLDMRLPSFPTEFHFHG